MIDTAGNLFVNAHSAAIVPALPDTHRSSAFAAAIEVYWRAFRRHLLAAAAIVAASVFVGLIATLLATPQYTASARIEISREAAKVTNVQGLESEQKNQDLEFYQTQYSLLTARTVALRVATRLNVVASDRFFDQFDYDIDAAVEAAKSEGGGGSDARTRLEKAADILLDHVAVRPVPGSRLVDVAFRSPSAPLSAEVANLWVQEFQTAAIDRRFESTADARNFLEKRLAELRKKLEDSQRQLVNYAAAKQIISLENDKDARGNTESSETLRTNDLKALNASLANAVAQRIAAESQANQAGSANQVSLGNIALNDIRRRRAEVAADLAKQSALFQPEYPSVKALQAELSNIDRSLATEEGRVRSAASTSYREALQRENMLRSQVEQLKAASIGEQRDNIEYAIFQREVDTNRELYEALLQRYKEIGVAGVAANNVSVVDPAKIPEDPNSPSLPLNIALSILAGMALAAGYVFVREQLDQSIRDPASVQEAFGLPLIGAIPQQAVAEIDAELIDPKSTLSEAYLSTASNLSFITSDGAPRSLAVTSTRPNEGKSTSAFAIALALSRVGKRVILVDCDLRNPSQHEIFGVPKEPGLTNLLASDPSAADVEKLCRETQFARLSFLAAGPLSPNPAALLTHEDFSDIVKILERNYDHVIVDGPPMLGLADAPLMAKAVDGVLYTIEANGLRAKAIQTGLRRLHFANVPVLGALVTKLNNTNSAYGYGDNYGYGYSYGSADAEA